MASASMFEAADSSPCQSFGLVDCPPPGPCSNPRGHFREVHGCCWVLQTRPAPRSAGGMGAASALLSLKRSKLGFREVLGAIWLFLEGILAETVLPPQAPVDIIYTLI